MQKDYTAGVAVQGAVSLPAGRAARIAADVLQELSGKPNGMSLSVDLSRDLEAPVEASLSVPVSMHASRARREYEFHVSITPASHQHMYPSFNGALRFVPARAGSCVASLKGLYNVPFGAVGATIDMTLLRGAARSSLKRLLDYILMRISERATAVAR